MNKRMLAGIALLGSLALGAACTVVWRTMSKRYIARWEKFPGGDSSTSKEAEGTGNICIVSHVSRPWEISACADVHLVPDVYRAMGVDESHIVRWQDEHGFDSGGVDPTGTLLAPGYPIFSRLAWTLIEPVYLQGQDLSELMQEAKRISLQSNDPVLQANLRKLTVLAERALVESKALRLG
jgi:hypothetical protein